MSCLTYIEGDVDTSSIEICSSIDISFTPPYRESIQENYCMGIGLTFDEWQQYWSYQSYQEYGSTCQTMFFNKIYNGTVYNEEGFRESVEDFNYMFAVYFGPSTEDGKGGHRITSPNTEGYSSFTNVLLEAISNNPTYRLGGVAQCVANVMCSSCNSSQITSSIYKDSLLKLCGCQVSSVPDDIDNVPEECDPMCTPETVAKRRDYTTGEVEECTNNVCVINDVTIDVSTSTNGSINIYQMCPQCDNGQCTCIIDESIIELVSLNDEATFTQYCGDDSICLTIDNTTGITTVVDCNTNYNSGDSTDSTESNTWFWILAIIIVIFVIIIAVSVGYEGEIFENKNV